MKEKYSKELIWFSSHPNIYNDYLFQELVNRGVDLTVFFNKEVKKTHPWKKKMGQGFKWELISKALIIDWTLLIKCIFLRRDKYHIIIAGWSNANFILITIIFCFFKKDFSFWTDTPNYNKQRSWFKKRIRNMYLKILFRRVNNFLVTGSIGVENAIKMGVNESKIVNFPFATDNNYFKPRMGQQASSQIKIISCGRLDISHKGQDVALKALKIVKDKGFQFQFKVAGTGRDEEYLKKLVSDLGLEEDVQFVGWKEADEILDLYQDSHIMLHTSHFDPFPNSVLEAMSCGLVVVGSELAGSVVDRIDNGINGYIHEDGNVEDVASKLENLISDRTKIDRMKIAARKTALEWNVSYNYGVINNILNK